METLTFPHGIRARIVQDDNPSDPRKDWDHPGTMVCWHDRYTLGDVQANPGASEAETFRDLMREVIEAEGHDPAGAFVAPLWLHDHSGLSISAEAGSLLEDFDGCKRGRSWDTGVVGFYFLTAEAVRAGWEDLGYSCDREAVKESEVTEYDQYLRGDVYGVIIEDAEGEELEALWGLYGYEYAEEYAKAEGEHYAQEAAIREAEDLTHGAPMFLVA